MLYDFIRPQHSIIVKALRLMDADMLLANRCWFGGGTAIVLKLGEYRRSLDVDFLCSDQDGYRALRMMAVQKGIAAFFPAPAEAVRDMRADQYGIRAALRLDEQIIKFEIVREARIDLAGGLDADLGIPALVVEDMFAEKLLANSDRCQDRSVAYRDAIDLGMLVKQHGEIPELAMVKAVNAYGTDILGKLKWVTERLRDLGELHHAAGELQMEFGLAREAVDALQAECSRLQSVDDSVKR
jgi:hypothetical protein